MGSGGREPGAKRYQPSLARPEPDFLKANSMENFGLGPKARRPEAIFLSPARPGPDFFQADPSLRTTRHAYFPPSSSPLPISSVCDVACSMHQGPRRWVGTEDGGRRRRRRKRKERGRTRLPSPSLFLPAAKPSRLSKVGVVVAVVGVWGGLV